MPSAWIRALQIWNKGQRQEDASHTYTIPRKGTEGYREVREVMEFLVENPRFFDKADDVLAELDMEGAPAPKKRKGRK